MDCCSTFEESVLIFHMEKNVGWICPLTKSFHKTCTVKCWAHKFVFTLKRSRTVVSQKKKKRLIDRLIKKIKKENKAEFTCWCNRGRINKMTEKIDNNWKVNLVILESDIC